jgi:hypothetical protein
MSKMSEKDWLHNLHKASTIYNEQRAHRDFQADEVYKFVEWLHQEYGYFYSKPALTNRNHQ